MSAKDERDVTARQRQRDRRFEPFRNTIPAQVVAVEGETRPSNRPSLTWIAEFGSDHSRTVALNDTTADQAGVWVLVGPDPRWPFRRVIGPYAGGVYDQSTDPITSFAVPPHAITHQMPSEDNLGLDPVKVYMPAIQPLKTTGDGTTLVVATQSLEYIYNRTRRVFQGQYSDLTSYVPGSGARRVLLYLDEATSQMMVVLGTVVVDLPSIPTPYPLVPTGAVRPSAWVRLAAGQTAVITATHIDNARDFARSGDAVASLSATAIGQILISLDGATFEARLPLLSEYGWLLNDAGLMVL